MTKYSRGNWAANYRGKYRPMAWALIASHMLVSVPVSASQPRRDAVMVPWSYASANTNVIPDAQPPTDGPRQIPWAAQASAGKTRTRRITPNRTVPHVAPVPLTPVFSAIPSEQEIFRARVFSEPLVPVMATAAAENEALVQAVTRYNRDRSQGVAPFEQFLSQFPSSGWRPSLLANLGSAYLTSGRASKALQAWDAAWEATKYDTAPLNRAVADLALGHWLQLTTNMGNVPGLVARIEEVEGRDVGGAAGSKLKAAREGLWILQHEHDMAAGSGPMALNAILRSRAGTDYAPPRELTEYHTVPEGASLTEIQALAERVGLRFQMVFRTADVRVPVPSVIHLKADHFSAVVEERGDQYRLRDLIFGGDAWITREALREEASGYFLIGGDHVADGWRAVSADEGAAVIGHCAPGLPDDEDPCPCGGPGAGGGGSGNGPPPAFGMPVYDFMPNRAALRIVDVPVGYSPPKGPSAYFGLTYSQREALQPQIFTYWNAGPKWTFDWLSFVMDQAGNPTAARWVFLRGGGREQHQNGPNHWRSAAALVRTSTSPVVYERRLPDGTVEVFAQSDGVTSGYRRIFLTQIIDPRGQTLTFTYDSSLRLVAATDALGQVTLVEYDDPLDSLKVTSVTDPFGRTAQFTYNSGRLVSITDVIGLTSSFSYGPGDFVAALTTPYGTTVFRHEPAPQSSTSYRMIEATDPLGGTERLEFHWIHGSIPATAPSDQVPTGFADHNANLNKWNTLYWDKRAWALYPADVTKATISHWLISPLTDPFAYHGASTSVPHSIKRPLEDRVWYAYPGQGTGGAWVVGTYRMPSRTARVLDDDSSQIWQTTYNGWGLPTSQTDPLGRETSYTYATNDIDVLESRQTTGSLNDLLASYTNYTSGHQAQSMTDAAGETTTFTHNTAGQILTVTNPLSETTTYAYDTDGYLSSVTGPVTGAATTYAYDDYGRIEALTDSDDYEVVTEYDALGRPLHITYPDATHEDITYDKLDAATRRDREGKVTRTFYDSLRRVTAVRDPLGRIITQQWCDCDSLDRLIDAKGQSTTWERDVQGRVTREVRADGMTDTEYAYETTTSRLKAMTDPMGQVTTFTYASDDRLLSMELTNLTNPTADVEFSYHAEYPRLVSISDGTGTTSYVYRVAGILGAGKISSVDGPLGNDTVVITYDELGRVTSRLVNGSGISSIVYDQLGRVTQEQNEIGNFTYEYDGTSQRIETMNYPNGQTSQLVYFGNSADHELSTIHHKRSAGATISRFDYTYTVNGNIASWRQQSENDAVVWSYRYDAAAQLVQAIKWSNDPTPAVLRRIAYTYDQTGNRSTEQINDTVMGASHDSKNRITSHQPSGLFRVAGALSETAVVTIQGKAVEVTVGNVFEGAALIVFGTTNVAVTATDSNNNVATNTYQIENGGLVKTFTFDANGNIISDGVRTFTWDGRNQLIAVEVDGHRTEFTYNGARQRVGIRELENSLIVSERKLLWCGQDLCEERDASNVVMRRHFYHGTQENGTAHFFTRDHLGSIREVIDTNEAVEARYDYEPFGARTTVSGTLENTAGFGGYYWHSASNLALAPYRAYDPSSARWTSEDPLGTVDGPNLFAYVANNPVSWRDPTGLVRMVAPKGILPPNGNLWGGFDPQDGVCTWPAVFGNLNLCTFKCCESHDRCYFESRCNYSSWVRSLYGSSPCAQCNQMGVGCFILNADKTGDRCSPCVEWK